MDRLRGVRIRKKSPYRFRTQAHRQKPQSRRSWRVPQSGGPDRKGNHTSGDGGSTEDRPRGPRDTGSSCNSHTGPDCVHPVSMALEQTKLTKLTPENRCTTLWRLAPNFSSRRPASGSRGNPCQVHLRGLPQSAKGDFEGLPGDWKSRQPLPGPPPWTTPVAVGRSLGSSLRACFAEVGAVSNRSIGLTALTPRPPSPNPGRGGDSAPPLEGLLFLQRGDFSSPVVFWFSSPHGTT